MSRVESVFSVRCLVPEAQPTRAGLRERPLDGVSYFASHPVDLNEKFAVDHDSSEKPFSPKGNLGINPN